MSIVRRGQRIHADNGYTAKLAREILDSIYVDRESGCWIWTKSAQRNGYGQKRAFGKMMPAHRAVWLVFRGEITDGKEIAHCCGNRKCVNPSHLKELTHFQNMKERQIIGNNGRRTVVLDGREYGSVAIAANELDITRSTVRYRERKQGAR